MAELDTDPFVWSFPDVEIDRRYSASSEGAADEVMREFFERCTDVLNALDAGSALPEKLPVLIVHANSH